jgi:hypothetical protein
MFKRAKGDVDRQGDLIWFAQVFLPLYEQVAPIILDIDRHLISPLTNDTAVRQLRPLQEAIEKLPSILELLRHGPEPSGSEMRKLKKQYESGLEAYIESCEWGLEYLNTSVETQRYIFSPSGMCASLGGFRGALTRFFGLRPKLKKLYAINLRFQKTRDLAEERLDRSEERIRAFLDARDLATDQLDDRSEERIRAFLETRTLAESRSDRSRESLKKLFEK